MSVTVSLATNNPDNGMDTGRVSAIEIDDAIDLHWNEYRKPRYRILNGYLFISRKRFKIQAVREWYGNWCWTGVEMYTDEAARLLNHLAKDKRWHCEGGWCELCDAYEADTVISSTMLSEISQ